MTHAFLSPSSAHRWMACPGSVALSQRCEDSGSRYADEGTAAHFLAQQSFALDCYPVVWRGSWIHVVEGQCSFGGPPGPTTGHSAFEVDDDMVRHVTKYVDAVRACAAGGQLLIEQSISIGHITGEHGATGTADAVVITPDGELQIHDLKYGVTPVYADDNEQLMLYALGACLDFEMFGPFTGYRITIHQPRIDNHISEAILTHEALARFEEKVRERAVHALSCLLEKPAAIVHHLRPGDAQCRWCPAKAICPKIADWVQEQVGADFEEIADEDTGPLGVEYPEDQLSQKMAAVPMIEEWLKAIRAEVERRLLRGDSVSGFKLVQGKAGPRKWVDVDAAEAKLKSMGLKVDEMYDKSLASPTSIEKIIGPKGVRPSPRRWTPLQQLIARSEGKPSVAPVSDKRPAWSPTPVETHFEDLTEGGLV